MSSRVALALAGSQVVGAAHLTLDKANPHTAWVRWLAVDPAHRRRGVGGELISALRHAARTHGFPQLGHAALADSDAASGFGAAVGAAPGLVAEQNRLLVEDLPAGMLEDWIARAGQRAAGYSLVSWNNECPDEYLERAARAYEVMNTAPDQEDEPLSVEPERVRAGLEVHGGRGEGFHTTVLHERSGDL